MSSTADLLLNILSRSDRRAINETADDLDKTARKADDTGKSFRGLGDDTRRLDAEIEQSKTRLAELGKEFERTGDKTTEFKKKLSSERSNVAWLEKLKKDLESVGDEGGKGLVAALSKNLTSFATDHKVAVGIAAGIAAGAPIIGAAASAAVLLGLGGGTLAAGIALAAKDNRVIGAFGDMFSNVVYELQQAASPFIQPLLRAAGQLGEAFDAVMPDIRKDFQILAPVVDKLVDGFGGFLRNIMPGFNHAIEESAPILTELADELPALGAAVGRFFDEIAAGGPGARQFFHDFMTFLDQTLVSMGVFLGTLSKSYALISGLAMLMTGNVSGAMTIWEQFGDHTSKSFQKIDTAAGAASAAFQETTRAIDDTAKSMRDFVSEALGMQDSELGLKQGLLDIADALKSSNGHLDTSNRLGLAARQSLQGQIDKIAQVRKSMLDQGLATAYVNDWTGKQIQAMYDDAHAHGANKAELDKLIDAWKTMLGLNPTKTMTTTFKTLYVTEGSPPPAAARFGHVAFGSGGTVPGRAGGGPGGGFFDVGENGRETVYLPTGAYVMPNNRLHAGAGPDEVDAIDIPLNFKDRVTGEVVQAALLRLARRRGYKTTAQLLPL